MNKYSKTTLHIFYRISDKGENKDKLNYVNNKNCLENFLKEFPSNIVEVVADNVVNETMKWLENLNLKHIHRTSLGNSGSFWFTYKLALSLPDVDYVYFVENDYIHKPNSMMVLLEGLKIADYVTLYDHPDKYIDGINPRVKNGGEKSKVFLTNSSHWKITNSTTMTFASKVALLQKDQFLFRFFTIGIILKKRSLFLKIFSERRIPNDYFLFTLLTKFKKRSLISPIPGYSTHGEKKYLTPLSNWAKYIEF